MYTYIYIDRYVYNYIYIVFTLKDTFIANQHWDGISRYLFHCPVFLGYIPNARGLLLDSKSPEPQSN